MPPLPVTSLSISFPVNLLAKAFNTFCINFIIQFNFFLYRKPFPVPALLLKMLFNIRKFLSGKFRIRSSLLFHLTFLENLTLLIILSSTATENIKAMLLSTCHQILRELNIVFRYSLRTLRNKRCFVVTSELYIGRIS